jgi:hypothetical protein
MVLFGGDLVIILVQKGRFKKCFFGVEVPDWHKCAVLLNLHIDPSGPAAPAVRPHRVPSARASGPP